ncbi:MAG TPA: hypothetical protein DCS43_13725 [Verrucomicrobia bacterium]|nr:hypothetical protein [Verrucomicrobiota bacterium]
METTPTPSPKHHHWSGWPAFIALSMIGLGLAASGTLCYTLIDNYLNYELQPHVDTYIDRANKREQAGDVQRAFQYHGWAIDQATDDTEQIRAILAMINFLMTDNNWQPAEQRYRMAAEYILALQKRQIQDPQQRQLLIETALRLAGVTSNRHLWDFAQTFGKSGENEPATEKSFTMLTAEFEALLALKEQQSTFTALAALEKSAQDDKQLSYVRHQRLKLLWMAIENDGWREACTIRYPGETAEAMLKQIEEQLTVDSNNQATCGTASFEADALVSKAKLALRKQDHDLAILELFKAIEKKGAASQGTAAGLLLQILNTQQRHEDMDRLRLVMLADPGMEHQALEDLAVQLDTVTVEARQKALLIAVDEHARLAIQGRKPQQNVLIRAAEIAIVLKDWDRAAQYLKTSASGEAPRQLHARRLHLQAQLAEKQGDKRALVKNLHDLITTYPDDQVMAGNAQFMLLSVLEEYPLAAADLVGVVVGATLRFPRDPRNINSLLNVAHKLEAFGLPVVAQKYYRHVILLSSLQIQRTTEIQKATAEATLGQARTLLTMGQDKEANHLLRTINGLVQWSDVWPESGPLWSAIALRHGQHREAVRRWRQTCGPPGGDVLPYLFGILVPDAASIQLKPPGASRPAPAAPTPYLMEAVVDAAFKVLLERNAFDEIDKMLTRIAADPLWSQHIPLDPMRVKTLEHILAREPAEQVISWMNRQAVANTKGTPQGTLLPLETLQEKMRNAEQIAMRARQSVL